MEEFIDNVAPMKKLAVSLIYVQVRMVKTGGKWGFIPMWPGILR
ncbi:MAG: hypothetical protein WC502_11690 [Methanolinea sp.]|jgi:hypothetical protein